MSKKIIEGWFKSVCTVLGQGQEMFSVGLSILGLFNLFFNEYKGGVEVKQAVSP